MKRVLLVLCLLGVAWPYYQIVMFMKANDWSWSTSLFFEQINANEGMRILNADLTIAATTFLVFSIYLLIKKSITKFQFFKYLAALFLVGFSLALPLYLYENYERFK